MSELTVPTPPTVSPDRGPKRKRSFWKIAFFVLLALVLVLVALWWWHNRPIKPVQLSAQEKAVVEDKLQRVQPAALRDDRGADAPVVSAAPVVSGAEAEMTTGADSEYQKGDKEFIITERELNGLLNEHTKLGDSLRFELYDGEVRARAATKLDEDFPIIGGKTLKMRARFFAETNNGVPSLVLDDLTVWGVSLPNDWIGGLKGQNILGEVLGTGDNISGVEHLEVQRGQLWIKLKE